MPKVARNHDPKTKADFLNRMFSFDFNGDIRNLGDQPGVLNRTALNKAQITFPASGTTFELVIRKPRAFAKVSKTAAPVKSEEPEATAVRKRRTRKKS